MTINKKETTKQTRKPQTSRNTAAPTSTTKVKKKPEQSTASRVELSKESQRGPEKNSGLGSLLQGLESNFGNGNSNESGATLKTKGPDNKAEGKTAEGQKPDSKLNSANLLKDIKAGKLNPEEIEQNLKALEQQDPEAAKKLRELLENQKKNKGQEKAGAQGAAENGKTAAPQAAAEHGTAAGAHEAGGAEAAGGAHAPAGGAPAAGGAHAPKGPTTGLEGVPAGFLWKPSSESDGNLVILTPAGMGAQTISVNGMPGRKIPNNGKNGGRDHFRFPRPGAAFGQSASVTITSANGQSQSVSIPNPAQRNEGKG
jgi:hypothetical protein